MSDLISRQAAIDEIENYPHGCTWNVESMKDMTDRIKTLPSAQSDSCNGCKWEYAFGYGECHHCKRSYNDMYEVENGKTI